jgi:ATP-dependent helicase HrpB
MLKQWPKPFASAEFFDQYLIRQRLALSQNLVGHAWDPDELKKLLIAHICDEANSFADVTARPLEEWLRHCVGEDEFTIISRFAPMSIKVGAGHRVDVHYPDQAPPWIDARLQNFFGQAETPKILDGRLPLTLHLLAPNMRALQVTTDLASFWRGVYPSLRNEYMRKYPRHYWPENPMDAEPPPMKTRRR